MFVLPPNKQLGFSPVLHNLILQFSSRQVVDLLTLTVIGKSLSGHVGYTPSEKAFYLYVDVSETYVGSGSEDGRGCIWDRHYGALVCSFLTHNRHSDSEHIWFLNFELKTWVQIYRSWKSQQNGCHFVQISNGSVLEWSGP